MTEDCLFCKIVKHEMDAVTVFENEEVIAFLDINPAGPLVGHTVVISKEHYENIEEIPEKRLCEMMKIVKKLVPAIKKVSQADGVNIIQNNGKASGQFVPHIHFHIIPRKHGDGIWFDTKRRNPMPLERIETAKAIKSELEKQ
ncbi:MAG: HIT family protein [archaeon]